MAPPTHAVTVPEVGEFVFRRRTLDTQIKLQADAVRLTGGEIESTSLTGFAMAIATLRALTVRAPDGWNLDEVDPLDEEAMSAVLKVFGSLRAAEETFRSKAQPERAAMGAGT